MECGKCKGGFRDSNTLELLALHLAYLHIIFCNIETKWMIIVQTPKINLKQVHVMELNIC
jgi:hypothetical protein